MIEIEKAYSEGEKIYNDGYSTGEYCHEQSFTWGFQEGVEYAENKLLAWNSPSEIPNEERWILMKIKGKDKSVFYIEAVRFTGAFYDFSKINQELVGWRYIYE